METIQSTLVETIQSTTFRARRKLHKAHNSALADHITIPRLWRQYKAHSSTLVETIQSIKHTIPRLRITLQFYSRGNNTKHTVPHWWRQYKAQHSMLVKSTQNRLQKTTIPYIQQYDTYDITNMTYNITKHIKHYNMCITLQNIKIHITL